MLGVESLGLGVLTKRGLRLEDVEGGTGTGRRRGSSNSGIDFLGASPDTIATAREDGGVARVANSDDGGLGSPGDVNEGEIGESEGLLITRSTLGDV